MLRPLLPLLKISLTILLFAVPAVLTWFTVVLLEGWGLPAHLLLGGVLVIVSGASATHSALAVWRAQVRRSP